MKAVFKELNSLDLRAYEKYHLSKDILMEHASFSIARHINNYKKSKKNILIVCGKGDNGADGIALARILHLDYDICLYLSHTLNSDISLLQLKRANALGLEVSQSFPTQTDIVIDCLYGSGLKGELKEDISLIEQMNNLKAYKIACDVPSGLSCEGYISNTTFKADTTITMGAMKLSLFSDKAKEYIGEIKVANLGLSNKAYEEKSNIYLLEPNDLCLPFRKNKNTHKYSYGHCMVFGGELFGAGLLSAKASLSFGCGAVSIMKNKDILKYDESIMYKDEIPSNTSAIVFGMGLGKYKNDYIEQILKTNIPLVIDADMFYQEEIKLFLDKENIVLTPHPKEFISLLKITKIATKLSIDELQNNRFHYAQKFTSKYPNITLLLKGANSIITQNNKIYINSQGSSKLSKAGSGDVLSGLIASLLAQGYSPIHSAINASLAHALAGNKSKQNNYALNPKDIIKQIGKLKI